MTTTLKAKEKQKANITTRQLTPEGREKLTEYVEILADIALKELVKKKAKK